jgi:serine protease Do
MNVDKAIAKQFGIKENQGVLVSGVVKGSAAEKGGVLRGDVITEFDNHTIPNSETLQKIVQITKPGKAVDVTVIRNKADKKLKLKLEEMPANPEEAQAPQNQAPVASQGTQEWKGIKVANLTDELAATYNIPSQEKGVVIISIDFSKETVNIGLEEGDLIKAVNQNAVSNVSDFKKSADKVNLSDGVVFDILRNGIPVYITYQEK